MDATYELHAQVLRLLADRRRLEVIHLLGTGPRTIGALAHGIDADTATVARHLSVLVGAGLVKPRPNGEVRYVLSDPDIAVACELMRGVLRRRLERASGGDHPKSPVAEPLSSAASGQQN